MKNKPIVIRMSGGLANRMFQYSCALYLSKKGYNVYVDNNYKPTKWKMEEISWEKIFPDAPLRQAPKWLLFKYGGGYDLFSKIRRHSGIGWIHCVYSMPNAFVFPKENDLQKHHYIIGIMQNAEMTKSIEDELRQCFKFNSFVDESNSSLEKRMKMEESVAIHVRKGKDYLTRPDYIGTCDVEYYKHAVDYVKRHVKAPKFYVFTDNPSWVKGNFSFFDYQLVDYNPPIGWGNHFDMQLMSCCKHNIIANSTYSWWGAFLNPNLDKIVIGPKYWFNETMEVHRGLQNATLCSTWVAI